MRYLCVSCELLHRCNATQTHLVLCHRLAGVPSMLGGEVEEYLFSASNVRHDQLEDLTRLDELDFGDASLTRALANLEHASEDGRVDGETSTSREELDAAFQMSRASVSAARQLTARSVLTRSR